jgi:putative NADH-flavin reductase
LLTEADENSRISMEDFAVATAEPKLSLWQELRENPS